jgi:pimeloyl-ACP methyl ester carboxylesterase
VSQNSISQNSKSHDSMSHDHMSSQVFVEPIVGRYMHLSLNGQLHRVYVEEAGAGVPLLCLHTAGADTRQYRALMNDAELLKQFRVIAFDLPWHGKSSPPDGWQNGTYRLSSHDYTQAILAVADALQLDQPIVMGCSIGGRIVLHLALEHPERFGAAIGLQSGAHVEPYYDLEWLHRSDVHGGEIAAGIVSGLIGPLSPAQHKWETLWHYMQSGPGVFKGDLFFYNADGDIRDRVKQIDTTKCPLWLLTGEYDYSCTPADTAFLGKTIEGVHWQIMQGMGHFPMSEDPAKFLTYLKPVLQAALRARTT